MRSIWKEGMSVSENDSGMLPGSPLAVKHGCACPKDRNNDGKGVPMSGSGIPGYYIVSTCRLHSGWVGEIEAIIGRPVRL